MIVVLFGAELLYRTRIKDIYLILLIGAISILVNAFLFPYAQPEKFGEFYGRYSGFYLNPNFAGIICIIGFAISFEMDSKWKALGLVIFTLAGVLTFSRTFIVIWVIVSLLSIVQNRRNIVLPIIGGIILILFFSFSGKLTLNTERFSALQSIFGDEPVQIETINKNPRNATWALYYDRIAESPLIGHGFMDFQKRRNNLPGVHNSFLMTIGEAGIIPFLILIFIYGYLLISSIMYFNTHPVYFYLSCSLILALMTGHQYFFNFYNVMISMFVYISIHKIRSSSTDEALIQSTSTLRA